MKNHGFMVLGMSLTLLCVIAVRAESIEEVQVDEQEITDDNTLRSCHKPKPCKIVCCPRECPTPPSPQTCGGIAQYALIANIELSLSGQAINQGANVFFNTNSVITSGFVHNTVSSQDQLVILNPGTYKVTWHVVQNSEGQWGLFLTSISNPTGTLIPVSIYGARGSDEIDGHALFCLSAADVASGNNILVLRNYTSNTPTAILEARAGGANPTINASLLIEQLNCPGQSLC